MVKLWDDNMVGCCRRMTTGRVWSSDDNRGVWSSDDNRGVLSSDDNMGGGRPTTTGEVDQNFLILKFSIRYI